MSDETKVKEIAEKVISKVPNNDPEKFGSIIMILMVVSILLTIIRVIQECNKNKTELMSASEKTNLFSSEIRSLSLRKTWFTKMTTRKAIRRELSREDYRDYGVALMNAILETGETLTDEETQTLLEAANV